MNTQTTKMPENITQQFLDLIKLPNPNGKCLRYLFVMPRIAMGVNNAYRMPYGFCLVSSALKASGRNVFTLNLNYKPNPYDLLGETIVNNDIDVVFTGGLSGQFAILKEILDTAKLVKPNVITCVGGGILTADPTTAMAALETADYGIIGEGELTVNAFAYSLENNENAGLEAGVITRDGTMGSPRPGVSDLDILPFPDYDGFEMYLLLRDDLLRYRVSFSDNGVPVAIGRSCPYGCTFCFNSSGRKYRKRSFESIRRELDWILCNYPTVKLIQFFDDLFSKDIEFLKKLTGYMKERNLRYQIFQRVDSVSREMLQLLKDSGCQYVFLGVESADDSILKSMRKKITVKQIEHAFNLGLEIGINVRGNIIFGDPEETPETIRNTLNWWKRNSKYNITTAWVFTFPGTHLYKLACDRNIISDKIQYLKNGDMQINLTKMPDDVYWSMVQKVSLFSILSTNGVDINFDEMDNIVEALSSRLDHLSETHKVAIWPAKFDIIAMLNEISPKFITSDHVVFVNIDPSSSYVAACERYGKRVCTPDEALSGGDIDTVFYALGSRAVGDMVYNQIRKALNEDYSSVKQLLKITDCI